MKPWKERFGRLWIRTKVRLGIAVPIASEDRRVLERQILPHFASQPDVHRVLFVGTAWYTAHYPKLMLGQEVWTIDPVPSRRLYGTRRHIVDSLDQLGRHSEDQFFDLIIVNGVIGYGLDDPEVIDRSFWSVLKALRPGGHLLLGWDDVDARRPVRPESISALHAFEHNASTPFGGYRFGIDDVNRKTYDFYVKPRGRRP